MGTTNSYKVGQDSKKFDQIGTDCKKCLPDTSGLVVRGGNQYVQVLFDMLHLVSSLEARSLSVHFTELPHGHGLLLAPQELNDMQSGFALRQAPRKV